MGKYSDALLSGGPVPAAPAPEAAPRGGYAAELFNLPTGELRAMDPRDADRVFSQPFKVVDSPAQSAGFGATLEASMHPDVEKQIRVYAKARGIDPARYGVDREGNVVFINDQGGLTREIPSVFGGPVHEVPQRFGQWLGASFGPSLPQAAAIGAGLATGPTAASIPAAGAAAAATDAARQTVGNMISGEDVGDVDLLNSAGQGLLGALGQGASVGIAKAASRNPLGVAAAERIAATRAFPEIERRAADAQARGINLTAGQASDLRSLRANERYLGSRPETADLIYGRRDQQWGVEVPQAVRDEIGRIGYVKPVDDAVGEASRFRPKDHLGLPLRREGMRGAARDMIEDAAAARTKAASPYYESAFQSGAQPDASGALNVLQQELPRYAPDHPAARVGRKILENMAAPEKLPDGSVRMVPIKDFAQLHSVKETIDDILKREVDVSDSAARREAERLAAKVQSTLTDSLKAAHPDYARGWQVYIDKSAPLDDMAAGLVGKLAKSTGLERAAMLEDVFARATPAQIAKARTSFALADRRIEWQDAFATWLDNEMTKALRETTLGLGNVPGKYRKAVWGDDAMRERVRAAFGDPAAAAGFEKLMDTLAHAARSLPEGSPTFGNMAIERTNMQNLSRVPRLLSYIASPLTAGERMADARAASLLPRANLQLAEKLMSPDGYKELKKLRMLNPKSEKALTVVDGMLARIGGAAVTAPGPMVPQALQPGGAGAPSTGGGGRQ